MSERRKKQLGSIRITRLDSRGRGRGVHLLQDGQERSVAVAGALPGDLVDVRVTRRKAGTFLGEIDRIEETDHPRTVPFCRHFGECGGCTTQNLAYRDQLLVKESMVRAAFREAGLTDAAPDGASPDEPDEPRDPAPDVRPIVPSRQERYYRNKLEYSFGAQRWLTEREIQDAQEISDRRGLGFHAPGRFDRVIDISECYLQPEPSSRIREFFRTLAVEQGYSYYDAREHRGLLRLLIVRTSLTGEVMVTVMFGEEDADARRHIMDTLAERFPEIVSLNYVINTSRNDSLYPHEVVTWRGAPYITERSGPNLLRIRPKAFYQTNPEQAQRLYETALEDVPGSALAFDLYSGIGSIALLLARRAERVVGVESVPDAVMAARENAELNGLRNVVFEEGEVESVLPRLADRYGIPDLVVVDPPRAGIHPAGRAALIELAPERIIYVSCNPRTQATDIRDLAVRYRIEGLRPVDMFPQTYHVENVAVLVRRDYDDPLSSGWLRYRT